MTTRDDLSLSFDKERSVTNYKSYLNLNINKNPVLFPAQLKISEICTFTTLRDKEEETDKKCRKKTEFSNTFSKVSTFTTLNDNEEERDKKCWKKTDFSNTKNSSTLSLHIEAIENSLKADASDSFVGKTKESLKKEKSELQVFAASAVVIQNPVEFPRQQNERAPEPQICRFGALQQLLNPNEMDAIEDIDVVESIDAIDAIFGEDDAENGLIDLFNLYRQYFTRVMWERIFRRLRRTRAARVFWVRRLFHDEHFVQITGFTRTEAQNLLYIIGHRFIRLTKRSWAVQVPEAFIIALRMLRTGKDFWNNGMFVGLSKSTAHKCFWQVVTAVISELSHLVSLNLTPQQWMHQATLIHNDYHISHVVGFIDGSYIMIKNVGRRKSWRCRKGFPAINMTLMVDGSGYIRFVSCRWPGAMHDSRVYRLSGLARLVREGWQPFDGASIGGDSAYLGTDNFVIARPRDRGINNHNRRFFRNFTKARATIENAIGHLKMSFGILSGTLSGPINCNNRANISKIIKCCCILENFKKRERQQFDEDDDHDFFPPLNPNQNKVSQLIRIFNEERGYV